MLETTLDSMLEVVMCVVLPAKYMCVVPVKAHHLILVFLTLDKCC